MDCFPLQLEKDAVSELSVEVELEVRYAETDQMGIVHHSVYPTWFEVARTRLCLETGYHYAEIENLGYFLVVTRLETRYDRGARYGDTVTVCCSVAEVRSRTLRFAYRVRRGEENLASGFTEHAWVEKASGKACRIPSLLTEPFYRLAGRV